MDSDYYLGLDEDPKDRALLEVLDRDSGAAKSSLRRKLWTAASTLTLAALAVGAYVAAPSNQHAVASSPPSAVLLSDQYGSYGAYGGDTSTPAPATPSDVYGNELPEGRAVKCGLWKLETFRYTNGERRLYPTATIALSWDPSYLFKFSVVDCNQIPRGADMTLKLPSPSSYPEGQAIKCDPSQAEVYRLVGGKRCWYPTSTIASSWDSLWSKFVVVDCSSLPKGDDMQLNPKSLPEGQTIKCGASASAFFRIVSGKRCAYTSNAIASSWDANWSAGLAVDCSVLPTGPDLQLNPKGLPEGQAIKCSATATEIFRLVGGKRCRYPTTEIALSWDKNFNAALAVDCTVVTQGPDLCYNHQTLPEGQAIKCSATSSEYFRLVGGKRCRYPTTEIALSWDKNYNAALVVDCTVVAQGPDLCTNPKELPEGQAIKCSATATDIFRLVGGKRCRYPTPEIALSWDKNYNSALVVDCSVVTQGPDLCHNPKTLPEGQAIKCSATATEIFRFVGGKRCRYPTTEIALSWDKNYNSALVVDCSVVTQGPDLCYNHQTLPEGQAIKCSATASEYFRLVGGKRCRYPTTEIALSWDKNYNTALVVDCTVVPQGPDLCVNPKDLPDGQAIKCSASAPEVYRLVAGGKYRWYPNEAVASSWDASWSTTVVVVDCSGLVKGDNMCTNPKTLPEGQAIKCSASAPEVYRLVAGGKYRWYPNEAVASSWDASWSTTVVVVDCSGLVKGDNMCTNPKTLPEGQAIKCSASAPEVYRLVAGGKYRWYPNEAVASSWDASWSTTVVVVDCSGLVKGDNMCTNPKTLPEGQAIKCSATATEIFRFVGGKRCRYPTTEIALSWDKNYNSALVVDCSVVTQGPDLCYNHQTLPEGQAIKCSATASEYFRLVGGKRCRYPTTEIALSWDKNYNTALVVDCTVVPQGPDLCVNPKDLPDGQAIKCSASAPEVYRLVAGGKYRWYPNEAVASSWDASWSTTVVVVDCSGLVKGDNMCTNPKTLPEGQAIKCSASAPEVYRLVAGGKYRWYPNEAVASSWDASWSTTVVVVDCSGLVKGNNMCTNPKTLPEGQAIKCSASAPEVYRLVAGGKYRWYPNEAVASSWDASWSTTVVVVDCSGLVKGDNMCTNPKTLPEGQAIKCSASAPEVYRLVAGGKYRWYPNEAVASSWDASWSTTVVVVDCSGLVKGDNMCTNPKTLPEGQAIKCSASAPEVYRLVAGGKYRWYPNEAVASSWDASWSTTVVVVDCSGLVKGDNMCTNPKTLPEGQAIKCSASAPEVYRLVAGGKYRWYPNEAVASSWDASWSTTVVVVDCSGLVKGDNMCTNPKTLPEGQAIKCSASAPEVYRLVAGGKYRWYPNEAVASSWDASWSTTVVVVDCSGLVKGDNMCTNPKTLPEGQAIKCSASAPEVYRLVAGGKYRWYPNEAVASSWDASWSTTVVVVDCSGLVKGDNMCTNPKTLPEGQAIKCSASAPEVYRLVAGGKYRWYPNEAVASSWDASWSTTVVVVDCSGLVKGDNMCTNPKTLPEGQAIKCSASAPEVYRLVAGGKYRWYPNEAVASSWDASWSTTVVVVDCSGLVKGDNMCTNPKTLPEGQAIKCSASAPEVYRLVAGGKYRWYPNEAVASSWDASWSTTVVVVDCSGLVKGDNMCTNPTTLPNGTTIKCEGKSDLFRVENKKARRYPSLAIATSWDADCSKTAIVVDCTVLPPGDDMCFNQPVLENGQAVKCLGQDATKVFRYCDELVRWYSTTSIADSWDPAWKSAVLADCSKFKFGPDMTAHTSTAAASAY